MGDEEKASRVGKRGKREKLTHDSLLLVGGRLWCCWVSIPFQRRHAGFAAHWVKLDLSASTEHKCIVLHHSAEGVDSFSRTSAANYRLFFINALTLILCCLQGPERGADVSHQQSKKRFKMLTC